VRLGYYTTNEQPPLEEKHDRLCSLYAGAHECIFFIWEGGWNAGALLVQARGAKARAGRPALSLALE